MFALILGLDNSADKQKICEITSGRLSFENEPSEICSHLRDKGQDFLRDKLQNHTSEEKGKEIKSKERARRTKGGKEKKGNEWLHSYSFYIVYFEDCLARKKLLSDCFKKFGYIYMYISCKNK